MQTVNKEKLSEQISRRIPHSKVIVNEVIGALFEELKKEYKKGNRIEIRGFGSFYPHLRKSKPYKNPNTSKKCIMPEKTTLKFKSSKQLYI